MYFLNTLWIIFYIIPLNFILVLFIHFHRKLRDIIFSFFCTSCASFHVFTLLVLPSSSVSLSYFILAIPMRQCSEEHSCVSSTFPAAGLNDTSIRTRQNGPWFGGSFACQILNYILILNDNNNNNNRQSTTTQTMKVCPRWQSDYIMGWCLCHWHQRIATGIEEF